MTDSFIGREIDGYEIRALLGHGGMAQVYRAYDAKLNRYVAIKVIDPQSRNDADYRERFRREARAVAQLRHHNIVGVHRFDDKNGLYYMVMDYIEGADLRWLLQDYLANGELMPHHRVLEIITQVAAGLDYAHKKGVVHRDIKPSNIMLTLNGDAIITDFGLALTSTDNTQGTTFGSAHYIAPEQAINSAGAVPQSDLYALGVTLYEILTGDVPFREGSSVQIAMAHVTEPPPSPQTINPALSTAFNPVLEKALAKEVKDRYQSGEALVTALKSAMRQAKKDSNQTKPSGRKPSLKLSSVDIMEKLTRFQREHPLPEPDKIAKPINNKPRKRVLRPVLLLLLIIAIGSGGYLIKTRMPVAANNTSDVVTVSTPTSPVTIVVKGVVRAIQGNTLTIYDLNVTLDTPLLQQINIGDMVELEGTYDTTATRLSFTALHKASINGVTH